MLTTYRDLIVTRRSADELYGFIDDPPLRRRAGRRQSEDLLSAKLHGDLQKSAKDSTLEHSLFAAFNTD